MGPRTVPPVARLIFSTEDSGCSGFSRPHTAVPVLTQPRQERAGPVHFVSHSLDRAVCRWPARQRAAAAKGTCSTGSYLGGGKAYCHFGHE